MQFNRVIGYPLSHTQSPLLHNLTYQLLGIDAVMLAESHSELSTLVQRINSRSVSLTAVTSPYKEKIVKYLNYLSQEVRALGAANTVITHHGEWYGYNTDVDGIAFAFRNINLAHKSVAVIGAGGAARAMGFFLKNNQANVFWINRTHQKAVALAKLFGGEAHHSSKLNTVPVDIIVNATSIGQYPDHAHSPLPNYSFTHNQLVFDMVYHPLHTQLLKQAKTCHAKIISGMEMFIGQGIKQIELFSGKCISSSIIETIRNALIEAQTCQIK